MEKDYLILKRASVSRLSGEWNDDDFDVLFGGEAVGHIFNANAAPVASPWMWTLIFPHHEGRSPTHGYEARGSDGGVRKELAAGIGTSSVAMCCPRRSPDSAGISG